MFTNLLSQIRHLHVHNSNRAFAERRHGRHRSPRFESLENRELLSCSTNYVSLEGRLYVTCDGEDDTITLRNDNSRLYVNDVEMPDIGNGRISVYADGGTDTLIVDEQLAMHNRLIDIGGNVINWMRRNMIETHDVESVTYQANAEGNEIRVETVDFALTIEAGGGNDSVTLHNVSNWYLDVDPEGISLRKLPIHVDGGTGLNQLVVDDANSSAFGYELWPDRFRSESLNLGLDFTYANFTSSVGIVANDGSNSLKVHGTAALTPGYQYTVYLQGGNDSVTLYPRNADGTPSIAGNMGILGGDGSDSIHIDDSASSSGTTWVMNNPFGAPTQDFSIAGGAFIGTYFDLENVQLRGSLGDDSFIIDSYQNGSALSIFGNGGDDRVEITPTSKDVAAFVTSIAYLGFDGGEGYDSFWFHNDNTPGQWWMYTVDETYFRADRLVLAPYYLIFDHTKFEYFHATRRDNPPTVIGQPPVPAIDELFAAIRSGIHPAELDLTGDGIVDSADVDTLVRDILMSDYGDADLDGEFNSSDLVRVFQQGHYEDGIAGNSGWADGDWNGDGEFDSADFVKAFQAGSYERGPRAAVTG
jgi:hypothetical protein